MISKFNKEETKALIFIFLVLIFISTPNFITSLMRGRDQNRKDDMGTVQTALASYLGDFGTLPLSTTDGKIIACKRPEDKVEVDKTGRLIVNLIPCEWGKDPFVDLTPGSSKVYIGIIPNDPDAKKGVNYIYNSDGSRYQLFSSLESKKDSESNKNVIARNIMCGSRLCNLGRQLSCVLDKTIEQCALEALQNKK